MKSTKTCVSDSDRTDKEASRLKTGKLLLQKPGMTCAAVSLAVIYAAAMPILAVLMQWITNLLAERNRLSSLQILVSLLVLTGIFAVSVLYTVVKDRLVAQVVMAEKERLFGCIFEKRIESFRKNNTSVYSTILNQDIYVMENDYLENFFQIVGGIVTIVMSFLVLWTINGTMVLIMAGLLVAGLFLPKLLGTRMGKYKKDSLEYFGIFNARLKDYFRGFEVIRSYAMKPQVIRSFQRHNRELEQKRLKSKLFYDLAGVLTNYSAYGMGLVLFLICAYFVGENRMRMGDMVAVIQLSNSIMNPSMMLILCIGQMISARDVMVRIEETAGISQDEVPGNPDSFSKEPCADLWEAAASQTLEDENLLPSRRETGISDFQKQTFSGSVEWSMESETAISQSLTLENVTFQYPGAESPALKDCCLVFEKGRKYVITGRSGSGKSTLLKLILRYYSGYSGTIRLDGVDYRALQDNNVYDRISYIQQQNMLFHESMRFNLTLGLERSEMEMETAIDKAVLGEVVNRLEEGLDTVIEEDGGNLSGGERQRIEICRALLKESEIFVTDEITSGLDAMTTRILEDVLTHLDATVINVTHDLDADTLKQYDEIIVLDHGMVVERGSFQQLLEKKGQLYELLTQTSYTRIENDD